VQGLGLHLAKSWLGPYASGGERAGDTAAAWDALKAMPADALRRVATQVSVPGGRVDLELRFSAAPDVQADAVVVRVENKHGTQPHSGQLYIYETTMPTTGRRHAVVLLAPRAGLASTDQAQVPATVPQRSWQRTARWIADYDVQGPVAEWLRDEFCAYLQEEQLMDPAALRPEHLTALEYMAEAGTALALICVRAHEYLAAREVLGPAHDHDRPREQQYGIGFAAWWEEPPGFDPARWNHAWFDWGTSAHNEAAGMPGTFLYAGLSIAKPGFFDARTTRPDGQAELEHGVLPPNSTSGESVVFRCWPGQKERRLRRVALPQDVVRGTTLEAQGDSVGRWVEETYRTLIAHGAPL
jgi:hypothetical protein